MRTLIAIPCMDVIRTRFQRSLDQMEKVGSVAIGYIQGTLIYEARNVIASNAIKDGFDRVMWIDSDMLLPRDAMIKLSKHMDNGAELVSGIYFGRRQPSNPTILDKADWFVEDDGNVRVDSTSYIDYPKNALFEIAGCGFGCVMTSVDLLKRVVAVYGSPFTPMMGFGEDVSFCWRVAKLGVKMYCDSTIKAGHIGEYVYTEADFLARMVK